MSTQQARAWPCPKCPATFSDKKGRKKHKKRAHPTVCPECQAKFTKKKRFKQHWEQKHRSPCGDCGLTLKGQTALDAKLGNNHLCPESDTNCVRQGPERAPSASPKNEAQSVKKNLGRKTPTQSPAAYFECRKCDTRFDDEYWLRDHWNATHTTRYHCMECNQGWNNFSYTQLKEHQEACDLVPLDTTECLKCGTAFRTRAGVVYHLPQCESTEVAHHQRRTPEELPTFNCTQCTKRFTNPTALEEHVRALHTVEYRCCDCNSSWKQYEAFREHLKVCKLAPPQPFQCEGSPGPFTTQVPLDSDTNERLLSKNTPGTEETEPFYKCAGCEETATSIPELEEHQLRCVGNAWKCRECKFVFGKRRKFARHLEICRLVPPNALHCEPCGSKFKSRVSLISHKYLCRSFVSPSRPRFPDNSSLKECLTCSMRFSTDSALGRHRMCSHLGYNFCCLECATKFPVRASFEQHRKYCRKIPPGIMSCPNCRQDFTKRSEMVAHAAQCETAAGLKKPDATETELAFRCNVCRVDFANEGSLKSHGRFCQLLALGTWACPCCKQTFAARADLVSHLFECEGEAPLRMSFCFCNKCEARFTNLNALGAHWETHEAKPRQENLKLPDSASALKSDTPSRRGTKLTGAAWECPICSMRFSTRTALGGHQQFFHGEVRWHKATEPPVFTSAGEDHSDGNRVSPSNRECQYCKQQFAKWMDLARHLAVCNANITIPDTRHTWSCTKCEASFTEEDEFQKHIHAAHNVFPKTPTEEPAPILECGNCRKTFTDRRTLEGHQTFCYHFARRCKECNFTWTTYKKFSRHLKNCKQVPPNTLQCELCGKAFGSRLALVTHRTTCRPRDCRPSGSETAVGLKTRDRCDLCRLDFTDERSLKSHEEFCSIVSPDTRACPCCGQAFAARADLISHLPTCNAQATPKLARYFCTSCSSRLTNAEAHMAHWEDKHRRYHCSACGDMAEGREHERYCKMVPPDTSDCRGCGHRFMSRAKLLEHVSKGSICATVWLTEPSEAKHMFSCVACNTWFTRVEAFETHRESIHNVRYTCCDCNLTFLKGRTFRTHLESCQLVQPGMLDCQSCGHRFVPREKLVRHVISSKSCARSWIKELSATTPRLYCVDCKTIFAKKVALDFHRRAIHGDEYRCCDCDMKFSREKSLKTHMRNCKLVPRDMVQCPDCGVRDFPNRPAMVHHIVSGECKPVSCLGSAASCTRKFKKFEHMVAHLESGACVSKLNRHKIHELIASHDRKNNLTVPGTLEANRAIAETSTRTPLLNSSNLHSSLTALLAERRGVEEADTVEDRTGGVILTPTSSVSAPPTGILTPIDTSALPSPTGVLTPVSTTAEDASLLRLLFDPKTCPQCGKSFSTEQGVRAHAASPVHDIPRYKCPNDLFFTMLGVEGLKAPGHEKVFKTLSGLVGHLERGGCRDGINWKEVVGEVLKRVKGVEVKLLGGAV